MKSATLAKIAVLARRFEAPAVAGTVLAGAIAMAGATPLAAQASFGGGIGFRGGVNLTDWIGDDAEEGERTTRLNFGATFQLLEIGPVSIVPEVYYARKGGEQDTTFSVNGQPVAFSPTFDLSYVEVPVLARVRLPRFGGDRFFPYVQGGPAFAWNLDCEVDFRESAGDGVPAQEGCGLLAGGEALEEEIRDYETGFVVGAGLDIEVIPGFGALNLDARLTQGLSRVIETDGGEEIDIRNRAFSLMLGYSFGFAPGRAGGPTDAFSP